MMIGERNQISPTVLVPPWSLIEDDYHDLDLDFPMDVYSCDNFRMFEFKIRKCARGRSHDWTDCPYAHPGEKARRRDPRKYHYSGTACPEFRKGYCKKGESCEYAHGVFECWLHPSRYRTQPCKDGTKCLRRVCFFAHTPEQLRVLSPRTDSSLDSPPSESPPVSPSLSRSLGSTTVTEMIASLRQLQFNKVKSMPKSWALSGFDSPRFSITRPEFEYEFCSSLPSTPTTRIWEEGEHVMERVESGRGLRVRMFEKLIKENPLNEVNPDLPYSDPDVNWVSDLVNYS